ncbi:hypothetical protein EG329_002095 [Mollisiaceae sp. DMI_Dod_QoI]|nr:hypothetical protein EG329_002095 [Helotiales sp. DMI_Dod_QoI]
MPADIAGSGFLGSEVDLDAWAWGFGDYATEEIKGIDESLDYLLRLVQTEGPFEGIIGFSSGATAALLLVSMAERGAPAEVLRRLKLHPGQLLPSRPFKFGMFFSGYCTRDTLIAAADLLVAAQTAGSLRDLQALLTSDYKYQENNKASDVKTGVLGTALKIAHRKTTADTVACASYTELVATTPKPYVIGTQLRHTADGANITLIDTIAATTGALSFNAAKTLGYIEKEAWTTIDAAKRDSRTVIQAAGDAYLDMWSNSSAYNAVPWGTPCERVEGSSLNSPCTAGAPRGGSTQRNSMRRLEKRWIRKLRP